MGGWSTALATLFLDFVGMTEGMRLLDVGCGTGNLLAAARAHSPAAPLAGIDPSASLLAKAKTRPELVDVELLPGRAEAMPFDDAKFDRTLSLLVLQEFPDPQAAFAEMRRVTRPGGLIAGCQWDFERMPVIAANMRAIGAVDPAVESEIASRFPHLLSNEAELETAWRTVGLTEVKAGRISVTRHFPRFDDIWLPLLEGTTPSTLALANLPAAKQSAARELIRERLGSAADGTVTVTAEAMVVRGRR